MNGLFADTIYAPASGVGRFAITLLRVSGAEASACLARLVGPLPAPRRAVLRGIMAPDGSLLDRAMVLWLPGPQTYTGEDSFELHLHGGLAVLTGVEAALLSLGLRPAEPGEFTRRAFIHGRMDLLEAEAVADLIAAETSAQRDQALRQLSGELGGVYRDWQGRLVRILAQQEALIDFPDEDLPAEVEAGLLAEIVSLMAAMHQHLKDGDRGERLRRGLVLALAGVPNVGKSSLVNTLCRRDVAIVSPVPGTTRDVIEVRLDLSGIPVTLQDLAGLRETSDPVEVEGVRRAQDRVASADIVLQVVAPPYDVLPTLDVWVGARVIKVASKSDLGIPSPEGMVRVSSLTGEGCDHLVAMLGDVAQSLAGIGETPSLTRARHRAAVNAAAGHLHAALDVSGVELRGEELRLALRSLGRILGSVGVEELLDSVFSQFCIGK
jgi:tRNA modification GTPase